MNNDDLGDWRFEAISRLANDLPAAYPGGPSHKAGSRVSLSTVGPNKDGKLISFTTPSAVALALNIAIASSNKAIEAKPKLPFVAIPGPTGIVHQIHEGQSSNLFDFFEQCMISTTFSFQAIESFCNHVIRRTIKPSEKLKVRGFNQKLSVDEIERKLSTSDKLSDVLPKILALPTPKGSKIWEDFAKLRAIRDATVHLKSSDQYPMNDLAKQTLFIKLLDTDPREFTATATAIIDYFYSGNPRPRWLNLVPLTSS